MFKYTVQAMPGQKAKSEGDTSIKYRIKRQDTSLTAKQKGHSQIIRENLEYEEAMAQVKRFTEMEGRSQDIRDEVARQKDASS
jgi:CYTH domain-containing protein